jgi:hypothetical protein
VVVAVQRAQDNVLEILRALQLGVHPDVEVLFCHTPDDPDVPALVGRTSNARAVCGARGSLIPHLWRDGILAANGRRVATTTAHCVPGSDWIETLLSADPHGAAIGGVVENDPQADARAKAIFLLRYAAYAPPQKQRDVQDLAADNAVYPRADLLRHVDLLQRGFWEPSFHERLRAEGVRLQLNPKLKVVHRNRYSAREIIAQRFAHGREFGVTRASRLPLWKRALLVASAPGAFPLLLARIFRTTRKNPVLRKDLLTGGVWLAVFTLAWVLGEATGYIAGLRARQ